MVLKQFAIFKVNSLKIAFLDHVSNEAALFSFFDGATELAASL